MKVLCLEPNGFDAEAIAEIETVAAYRALPAGLRPSDPAFWAEVEASDAIWTRLAHRLDAAFLDRAPRLVAVASATTGLNHIDLDACAARDISVISLKGETTFLRGITATAELTVSLILEALRRTGRAHRTVVDEGSWERDRFRGRQLHGRTLGIVGLGRVGAMVAGYAHAFRMNVLFCDPRPDEVLAPPCFTRRVSFEEVLAAGDIVSLHADYTHQNRKLFDDRAFARMKSTALFVNTARGELVDEEALLHALGAGSIGGAALDVLDAENERAPLGLDHPLIAHAGTADHLVITPHIGGACRDAMASSERFVARKLTACLLERGARPSPRAGSGGRTVASVNEP